MPSLRNLFSPSYYRGVMNLINARLFAGLFPEADRIRGIKPHLDVINLGSNPAKYAIDYSEVDVRAHSLAMGPQTFEYDFRMLKNYHSFLDENGNRLLLLLLCPFTFCLDRYPRTFHSDDLRYYPVLSRGMINNFDEGRYRRWVKQPWRVVLRHPSLLRTIRGNLANGTALPDKSGLAPAELASSARSFIDGWKNEFSLRDFDISHLPDNVLNSLKFNNKIMEEMLSFCKEREIRPVFVVAPMTAALSEAIPADFKERCFYSMFSGRGVPVLDYSTDESLIGSENFMNALFMNRAGRKKFTARLISDLRNKGLLTK